ncbi:aromatic ring-hydroxylating dioxygenase subunit alpha [Ramlibacter sp. Leaf400]|uniref:aromatic ring-hydroxylating dioxygenase subunit alpha n=1 Tax=Ramlibacter sp. Leaf400 TaxID=1736365 RepID=UPI0006F648D8|nr:aromatic ring-hydroxylating dioxygenase subunit alpha [Ramlibacter sp. Leaf400]KQT12475.1 phenoxybenzoate dioxygenase [Ramlibacter sp. Leaf400]
MNDIASGAPRRVIPIEIDSGTAYGMPAPTSRKELTDVGPGTPMGELLRRYWHPVGLAADATDTPRQVRVLGEDLILFRDKGGRPGLVHPHCAHRGASLYYGKVEERGIRCCYHGWLFDVQGRCVEQPCEPQGGRARDKVRQPWYPVEELYGLVWAYLGPPDRKPVLPRYECLEQLEEGEFLEANANSIGGGGPQIIPCNWLQHYENLVDPFHVVILHSSFSGTQFVEQMALMPQVNWELQPHSVRTVSVRKMADGKTFRRISEAGLPTLRVIPSPRVGRYGPVESLGWVLPIDDHHFRIYVAGRVREQGELAKMRSRLNGKLWEELTEAEHQQFPGDYEAMVSQGAVARHSEEHLATTDRGIVMLRRLLQRQLEVVAEGGDPAGVFFDPGAPPVKFTAGNFLED